MSPARHNLWRVTTLIAVAAPVRLITRRTGSRKVHGGIRPWLSLRYAHPEGKLLAAGDLFQTIHGDRAVSRLVFHFKDGSIDDETAVFSQRGHFRLIRDRHIQRGPAFQKPTDMLIDAATGQVTVRYQDKDQEKVETDHLDLPPDLANGIMLDILKNISPDTQETKLSYVAADPKPRLVQFSIKPAGEETFSVARTPHKAIRFIVKVELGGLTGVIAPLIGKQPVDVSVWVSAGEVPAFVKLEGPLCLGCPIWTVEMTSPVWRRASQSKQ